MAGVFKLDRPAGVNGGRAIPRANSGQSQHELASITYHTAPPKSISSHRIASTTASLAAIAAKSISIIASQKRSSSGFAPQQPTTAECISAIAPSPSPTPTLTSSSPRPPLVLHEVVSTAKSRLFTLRAHFGGREATLLLDSGASTEFIDPAFAASCGLTCTPSGEAVKLADGSIVAAAGQVSAEWHLDTGGFNEPPLPFTSTFTATKLDGYDAIIGMTWLARHDPEIGWQGRTIIFKKPNQKSRVVRPLSNDGAGGHPSISSITMKGVQELHRTGQVEQVFAIFVTPADPTTTPVISRECAEAEALLSEFADVFPDKLPPGLPPTRGVQHTIDIKPGMTIPPCRPLRHQSSKDLAVFEQYTREMIEAGQIRVSASPYGAMALIVRKKDGSARVVVDYRGLNEVTIKNKYPLPLMDELFDRVTGAKYFTKIDLRTGFHQIRIADADVEKTAFRTRYGSYEYLVLPMGLCNAPGTFMQLMNDTFRDLLDKSVLVFLDDILVFSRTKAEHVVHVREVLIRLRANQLYAKRSKCELFRDVVDFLGHHIGAAGLSVSQDKIDAVRGWPVPADVTGIRSFLGLAGFYRRFVKDFSKIALPMTELTKDVPFDWRAEQQASFATLKHALCTTPVLLIPDPKLPYTLNCDACNYAIGATLQQDHGNGLQPVAFMSQKLTGAQLNWDTREKEFYALFQACMHWRHYLHSEQPFTLLSDHDSLKYHKTMPHLSGRLARWIEKMAEFNYDIQHIAGVKNIVADALSRRADLKGDAAPTLAAVQAQAQPDLVAVAADRVKNVAAAEEVNPPAGDRPAADASGVIRMPSQRCTANAKSGAQCKLRTAKGQYCWNHLRIVAGLRVKKSAVPGFGMGLHAARDLPRGTLIRYTGDSIPLDDDCGGAYFLQLTNRVGIDGARTNAGEGRWINDPKGSAKDANCKFCVYTPRGESRRAGVRTLKLIKKGEEIFVRYGAAYWRYHHSQQQPQQQQQQRQQRQRRRARPSVAAIAIVDDSSSLASIATISSSLTSDLTAAAQLDTEYAAQLRSPPTGFTAQAGLLIDGARILVPNDRSLRTRLLAECHDAPTGAHLGRDKVMSAINARFIWSGMAADVAQYVASCDLCQRNKPSQQLTPGLLMPLPLPERPCQEWTTDAVTGLPTTKRGHDAIQVYVDRLTKMKHFVATRKSDGAAQMARGFMHTIVRAHGVPESLVSDRDPRFTAHFYKEFTRLIGTSLKMSTSRHPQTDGQSENAVKVIITALRAYCNDHQDDWDEHLDMLELGFNSTKQASTQRSPFELLNGTAPRLPIDVALAPFVSKVPAAIDRATRAQAALTFARDHLAVAQQRQSVAANRHRRDDALAVGDLVLLTIEGLTLRGNTNKLCSRYVGPFAVTDVVNANAYTLALPPQLGALHPTFNIDRLKRYRTGTTTFPSRPQRFDRPPAVADADSNGDKEWLVERITARRRAGRNVEYLVSWVGYPPEDDTWEKRSSLDGAREALADFNRIAGR